MWQKIPQDWQRTLAWGALFYWIAAGFAVHGVHTCTHAGRVAHGHVHHATTTVHTHEHERARSVCESRRPCRFHQHSARSGQNESHDDGSQHDGSSDGCVACQYLAISLWVAPANPLYFAGASFQQKLDQPVFFVAAPYERSGSPRAPPERV